MPEQLDRSINSPEALQRCQFRLGCVARNRCVALPLLEGASEIALETSIEQGLESLQAMGSAQLPLTERDVEAQEEKADFLDKEADFLESVKINLAKCGIVQMRINPDPHTA